MTEGRWRTAFASVIGTSHVKMGAPCQDASACTVVNAKDGSQILLAAVADGAGTAQRSETGAQLAVELFIRRFVEAAIADSSLQLIDRRFVEDWILNFQDDIRNLASIEKNSINDYASTLLGAVVGRSVAIYVQIGDGAIVVADEEPGEYTWIEWPQHGEYANTTNFLTQHNACEALFFETGRAIEEIALFTDGIERLVLDVAARSVHSPAFRPIFEWLARIAPGATGQPSEVLMTYLGSDHVNQRTDDDKTLVMATRATAIGGG